MTRVWHKHALRALTTTTLVATLSLRALTTRATAADQPLTWPAAQLRLKNANAVAAQRNDPAAAAKVKDAALRAKSLLAAGNAAAAELLVRDAESAAGLDPGGASMAGLPIYHPTPDMADQVSRLRNDLDAALRARDLPAVRRTVANMRQVLGDQAGLPTLVTPGLRAAPQPVDPAAAVTLFLAALDENKPVFGQVATGRPVRDNPVRFYADLAAACCDLRPLVKKHRPDQLAHLDQLVLGACFLMTALQQPPGHMPYPDPKAKPDPKGNCRWNIAPDDDGGSQFDTGEAAAALLAAGVAYARPEWTAAGLKAADWCAAQPCVRNVNYTAAAVHALAHAYRATRNRKYLDAALDKWELGLAPAQLDTGRWIDPHNARTAHHVYLLRATTTLASVCPEPTPAPDSHAGAERREQRDQSAAPDSAPDPRTRLRQSATLALKSLLDEFDRLGVTNTGHALPVLLQLHKLDPAADPRLPQAIQQTAAAILTACHRDGRPHLGASPPALASTARVPAE